jgi:putative transposase
VRFAFIQSEKAWPVSVQCKVLKVSRSGFYAWRMNPVSAREARDAALLPKIRVAFMVGQKAYGSPRVTAELQAKGETTSKGAVERVMRDSGITPKRKRRFVATTDSNHDEPIAPNLLRRNFTATQPDTVWVTDATYIWTREGWLYLAVILDLFSRRVVGWAAGANNDTKLALTALRRAIAARKPSKGLIHHSDRGSTYASSAYRAALATHGAMASMSKKGDCWDNAVAESFFASIKRGRLDQRIHLTRTDAVFGVANYIDAFYNTSRRHSTVGYVSPIEFELKCASNDAASLAA